jgi:outer membrane lipoprotein-sorting protein
MRWCFTVALAAALAVPAQAQAQGEAEKLFRQVEKKLQSAKTVQATFDAKIAFFGMTGSAKGKMVLGEGDKFRLNAELDVLGKNITTTVVGDGTKVFSKDSEKQVLETKNSPKDLGAYFRGVWPRVGLLTGSDEATKAVDQVPKVDEVFQVSDFKLGAKEKVGSVETQVVEFNVKSKGKDMPLKVKVWIDTKASLPAKVEVRLDMMGIMVEFAETYTDFVIDGKLDAKLFEQPK